MKPRNPSRIALSLTLALFWSAAGVSAQDNALVAEETRVMKTFAYGDPDPVPLLGPLYPYTRFTRFSADAQNRGWKMIRLENPYLRAFVTPEIGGKVWGAVEKSTGREFIYFNKAVEFREIALRGPYTAGGIELNFGYIGHAPSTASPVDYAWRTNPDGSVSCIVGTIDLPSRSQWRVEVRVPRDKAYVETECFWYNPMPLHDSYYNWMTGSALAGRDLRFFYPGTNHIGHGGEVAPWPVDSRGRDISLYRNNDFESHKSYHILGEFGESFGGYWEDSGFGYGHWAPYSDKPGMKLWLWSLGRDGEIWTDLLLEGEKYNYIEMQTGLLYNQAAASSSLTPFKHHYLAPYGAYRWKEIWFPVKDIGGLVAASPLGSLNVIRTKGALRVGVSPIQAIDDEIEVTAGRRMIFSKHLSLKPLETVIETVPLEDETAEITVNLGNGKLRWSTGDRKTNALNRPLFAPPGYDWGSAEGLFMAGEELGRQREWEAAKAKFLACLDKEPYHLRALTRLAEIHYRKMDYEKALEFSRRVLSVDAYDHGGNFIYGVINRALGKYADARDGLGWASRSHEFRAAAYTELAAVAVEEEDFARAAGYARRSLEFNAYNVPGLEILAAACRHLGEKGQAQEALGKLLAVDPLNHLARFETFLLDAEPESLKTFVSMIRNELPHETYLELAAFYGGLRLEDEAVRILETAPAHPLVDLWLAFLLRNRDEAASRVRLAKADSASSAYVFPFRAETVPVLRWAVSKSESWKPRFYLALALWNFGRVEEAAGLFEACGPRPDSAGFYLVRAKFYDTAGNDAQALKDIQKAVALDPADWKARHVLFEHQVRGGRFSEALQTAVANRKTKPPYFIPAMDHAKALLLNGRFAESLAVLGQIKILPYEGAWEGHSLYRQACLYLAAVEVARKNHKKAAGYIRKARQWPENLGVGKPFDADERLENYLLALCYESEGKPALAGESYAAILRDTDKFRTTWDAGHYIGATAMKQAGRADEARVLLEEWKKNRPGGPAAWAAAKLGGDEDTARKIAGEIRANTPGFPYNPVEQDRQFSVLIRMLEIIGR